MATVMPLCVLNYTDRKSGSGRWSGLPTIHVCLTELSLCIVADGAVCCPVDSVCTDRPGERIRLACTFHEQKKKISDEFLHYAVSISRLDHIYHRCYVYSV